MLIYLIGLFAAIQGAKSQQPVINPTSCAPILQTVQAALNEMWDIVNAAYTRTTSAFNTQTSIVELRILHYLLNAYFPSDDPQKLRTYATDVICKSLSKDIYRHIVN